MKLHRTAVAALFAVALAGCASTGQYMDDAWITSKVKTELIGAGVGEVTVETAGGTVQLAGFVKSQADSDKAVATARKVSGVKNVSNKIEVRPQPK